MRKTFHQRLDEATEDVISMGSVVQEAVHNSIKALFEEDTDLAQKVIDNDSKIDDFDTSIEEKCMVIQAEYQPVARDLRLIHSIYIIVIHLERIGDIATSIAKLARRLYLQDKKNISKSISEILVEMDSLVESILDKALKAFKNRDAKLASKLEQVDDSIDDMQKVLYQRIYSIHGKDEDYIKLVTNISLVSRYLERIGDNSVNIGERVVYYLTGDFKAIHSEL
jgi:phosphate transport system protein